MARWRFPVDDTAFSVLAYVRAEVSGDTAHGHVQVYLVTYSAAARLIDTLRFASRNIHGYSAGTLQPRHIVEVKHYRYVWKNNRILSNTATGADLYNIDPTGHFRRGGTTHIGM